ncbi:MAG TPA: hypothetical protein VGJ50_18845 [Streptosporangiaceae bacterium]
MGLPYESPSGAGGYDEDDYSMSPDADRYPDDLTTMGYDGYQHDTSGGYADEDDDDDDDDDDVDASDLDDDGQGGQPGWGPGAGRV